MILPQSTFDNLVRDLVKNGGVATLTLPDSLAQSNKQVFDIASKALDEASRGSNEIDDIDEGIRTVIPRIQQNSNSAAVTGYHSAGGSDSLSRYNTFREGFVFSNGETFDIALPNINGNKDKSFKEAMNEMFDTMCGIVATQTLQGISRYLELDDESWFETCYGPMNESSQWHVKRYVEPETTEISSDGTDEDVATSMQQNDNSEEEEMEWLPVHTDPSLISVIIHDSPGYNQNAMGLQYQSPGHRANSIVNNEDNSNQENKNKKKVRVWKEVEAHGHSVATIFCGSVMSYITGGLFQSAKHRVIYKKSYNQNSCIKYRQAATLFLRPRGDSILTVPPCNMLKERDVKIRRNLHFKDWLNRVSKNYQQIQKKQQKANEKRTMVENKQKKHNSNQMRDPVHWADEYTELTLHHSTPPLSGREKYLGGELCELNGHIYTIPGFAHRVIDMDVTKDPPELKLIGPELPGEFKWLRGIPIEDKVYGIPCHAGSVLKIHAFSNKVELLQWDESLPGAAPHDQKWKYHGAAVSDHDGCIYCIPQFAEHVLKIDPKTDKMEFIGPAFEGVNKWYGGTILSDGAVYGICQNSTGILRIDPKTQQCTVHGNFPEGHYKWHGGVSHPNGNLYCIPAHADSVLKVEPGKEPKLTLLGSDLRTGEHRTDGKYKYLGGAVSGDYVYLFPSDADYVLEINTTTDKVREVGPNLRELESMRNNKWQNGFTAFDGTVYGIPLKGNTVLRIRPNLKLGEPDVNCIGGPYSGLNKWEGGVTAQNGDMFCIPLNHQCTLRIRPFNKK